LQVLQLPNYPIAQLLNFRGGKPSEKDLAVSSQGLRGSLPQRVWRGGWTTWSHWKL
jgi:hypothetical protein